jgi:ubiquinone/menaquinone biosynthesis C-methylase UbiE
MSEPSTTFAGSTPQNYHEGLGPMWFEPYARDLARRFTPPAGARVLEIAAGTGIVTRHLLSRLPADGHLTATDLGEAMLATGQARLPVDPRLEWKIADACALPFGSAEFDAVVCQFGLMFFPDKVGAPGEMRRVLKPRGVALLNVWGSLDDNPVARIAHETIGSFFPADPPLFYASVPYAFHEEPKIRAMFERAGFSDIRCDTVDMTAESASADLAARGLVCGSPVFAAINQRDPSTIPAIGRAVAERLAAEGGAAPMRLPMRARIFTAVA